MMAGPTMKLYICRFGRRDAAPASPPAPSLPALNAWGGAADLYILAVGYRLSQQRIASRFAFLDDRGDNGCRRRRA